ncbi:MAG: AMP-binding protein [Rhizobacter sp.]|nr:AMP-binding protein [Rhizobacter sp.]
MLHPEHPSLQTAASGPIDPRAAQMLQLVRSVADELRPQAQLGGTLGLDDSLERDYGLDSLARVELIGRLERSLGIALRETALTEAETPRDLLRFIATGTLRGGPLAGAEGGATAAPAHRTGTAERVEAPPDTLATLVDAFDWHLLRHSAQRLVTLYESTDRPPVELSYAELHHDATAMAAGLAAFGLQPGDKVAIMLPTGREFFAAFYGAQRAGMVPVPLYPPVRPSQLEDHLRRVAGILGNAGARLLVTVERAKPLAHLLRAQLTDLRGVCSVPDLSHAEGPLPQVAHAATDIAFLQYTSGSTGDPKGVILTHANLLANLRAMRRAAQVGSGDTFVSWLPLYHDMGLIGACLGSMVFGYHLVLMSPLAFLARPARWLEAIHRHRGTISAAPNFAFELCLAKIDERDLAALDLSSWRLAFNGAEPVSADTLARFAARFERCGFRRQALTPVYGLAENALGLAFPPIGRGPLIDRIDRAALTRDGRAVPARPDDAQPLCIVSCGLPLPDHELRVVDQGGRELPEREQGQVQFRGPSATQGYLANPAANQRLFDGGWLTTGDLGYFAAGELYLTGREKDLIIRGGFNIHPQELEIAVATLAGVRKGGVAVFAATDRHTGTERLVVLAETALHEAEPRHRLAQQITALSTTLLGAPADDVVLAPAHSVLKTSSGKTRRAGCRALYEQGRLGVTQRAPWRQWLALATTALAARARRVTRSAGRGTWALWAWAVFGTLAGLAWVVVMVTPGLAWRRRAARTLTRAAIRLTGVPLRVEGLEHLPTGAPCIVVANHASYLDSILLGAVLPERFSFAAKRELADVALLGPALRRLGIAFVERFAAGQSVEDSHALQSRVRNGESLVVFPEGTFRRASGLQPFKLGAFVVAAETGAKLVPVTLNGTRSILRGDTWVPRRCSVVVLIGAPLSPSGAGWDGAVALRDAARKAIGTTLAEPANDA